MPPKKSVPATAQQSLSAATETRPAANTASTGRKKWIPKTPIEVVLEQITRQEDRVGKLREELAREDRELQKLQQAKKVLEST